LKSWIRSGVVRYDGLNSKVLRTWTLGGWRRLLKLINEAYHYIISLMTGQRKRVSRFSIGILKHGPDNQSILIRPQYSVLDCWIVDNADPTLA